MLQADIVTNIYMFLKMCTGNCVEEWKVPFVETSRPFQYFKNKFLMSIEHTSPKYSFIYKNKNIWYRLNNYVN